jgi:hypothetical protein
MPKRILKSYSHYRQRKNIYISVCNALDKVLLIHRIYQIGKFFASKLSGELQPFVTVLDDAVAKATGVKQIESDLIWRGVLRLQDRDWKYH